MPRGLVVCSRGQLLHRLCSQLLRERPGLRHLHGVHDVGARRGLFLPCRREDGDDGVPVGFSLYGRGAAGRVCRGLLRANRLHRCHGLRGWLHHVPSRLLLPAAVGGPWRVGADAVRGGHLHDLNGPDFVRVELRAR